MALMHRDERFLLYSSGYRIGKDFSIRFVGQLP